VALEEVELLEVARFVSQVEGRHVSGSVGVLLRLDKVVVAIVGCFYCCLQRWIGRIGLMVGWLIDRSVVCQAVQSTLFF
jgi:hypothetical protein